jgi:LysR family transcriptional regulator, glycine cleavage system transcriptional activator
LLKLHNVRKRHLPPLNTLRGFEAAARYASFTKAAEELFVTQGAISRQVQELEKYLEQQLFRRLTRQIELTPEGEQYFLVVQRALDDIESASASLNSKSSKKTLTISVLPTIATLWLMPKLHRLASQYPGIEVRVMSSIEPADLLVHDADIAIRVGRLPGRHYDRSQPRIEIEMVTTWEGINADELFPDRLIPVCTPNLIKQRPVTPKELARYPLIHTSSRRYAWRDWLQAHDIKWVKTPDKGLQFGHFFMSLEAALQGLGVALIPEILLAYYDNARKLCVPAISSVNSAGEYYLLIHESRLDDPQVREFRSWILSEARLASEHVSDMREQAADSHCK